ncbi:cytidylyltransferase domain-containing protein [Desulfovibrio ferrophilus]|uniref:Acylneuraminate cytidylyltransferase n=1 Tax=Desulfovibrio ferrophilus TaxID=241368 RepID=A0A2Z6B196_9BACT|nr:acylneuraminate cytidylyltransferase family protein [Desulfovibrio ferrophilus]BBD09297.1 acylneuraminate cytidylyltransferase [Desulfovibrio ferrophilus]
MNKQGSRPEVLAIIPARGGSKGLPRKNILPLGGMPLVAWSIRAALEAKRITRVVVSTDDEEIAAVARNWGAEVPFLRPAELAGDRSNVIEGIKHVLAELQHREGYSPDAYCALYPTHPFRLPGLIDQLTALLVDTRSKVVTARQLDTAPCTWSVPTGTGYRFITPDQSQSLRPAYRPYGLYEGKTVKKPTQHFCLHVVDDPVQLIDIDTEQDLRLANAVVEAGLFPNGARQ